MKVQIYSVEASVQAGNIRVKYIMTTQKGQRPKPKENQLGLLGISSREFTHYVGNSTKGLGSRRERYWD